MTLGTQPRYPKSQHMGQAMVCTKCKTMVLFSQGGFALAWWGSSMAKGSNGWYVCYDHKECVPRTWSGALARKKKHSKCRCVTGKKKEERYSGQTFYSMEERPAVQRIQRKKALRLIEEFGWDVPLSEFEVMVCLMNA